VERCFNRLKQWGGIATRYEKTGQSFQAARRTRIATEVGVTFDDRLWRRSMRNRAELAGIYQFSRLGGSLLRFARRLLRHTDRGLHKTIDHSAQRLLPEVA